MERLLRHEEEELLFKGKNIHCRKKPLFEGWGDSLVYSGYFKKAEDSKEEIVVRKIKKIDCHDKWNDIFNKHTQEKDSIKHENVLKIISYEEKEEEKREKQKIDEWRYFALERYDATLEQFCKGFYKGPMPSDAQVLCQIAKGLLYLHKVRCSHGNLTPRTILIDSSQPVRMMIKLSEFGLSKFGAQCDEEMGKPQDLCLRKYWKLDGNTDNNQTPTPNQDIFPAGCICFYFLKRGVHPFGDDSSSILENIKKRNPVNLKTIQQEKETWEFAYEPIKNMIGDPPTDGTNWLMIAEDHFMKALPLRFEMKKENELGRGGFGVVYRGMYEGNAVAVKVPSGDAIKPEQKREMEEHLRLDHENVLKLLHVDDSGDKTCLVLELCAGTLKDYCNDNYNGPELPSDGLVLYQITNGLNYIHSQGLVHRDVKPDNILISMTTPIQIKLSDFGFVKKTSPQGSYTQSVLKGTLKWMAPEILEHWMNNTSPNDLPRGTIQSDTFAAGCVFFFFLTRGRHPFDEPTMNVIDDPKKHPNKQISNNVLNNKPKALIIEQKQNLQGDDRALYELIGKMIEPKEQRISLPDVIKQLTAKLYESRQFKKYERLISERGHSITRFHPTELVLACGFNAKVIFLSADNSSIPFSNWKEKETQLQPEHFERYKTIEWNVDGTQLAANFKQDGIVCWSYPSGEILFKKKLDERMDQIEWNPFRPNVFATFEIGEFGYVEVSFFNSCPVDQRSFHFCTIEYEDPILSFEWISENRVAIGLNEGIEIWEIDESTNFAKKLDKRLFQHERVKGAVFDMAWDERTKCLAACSDNGWMTIWSMDRDQPIHATKVDGRCYRLAWRPNGKQSDDEGVDAAKKSADNFNFACGLGNGGIVIWTRLDSMEKTRILSQHSNMVNWLSFSPDGRFLASADSRRKFIIWATENWQPVYINVEEYERWDYRLSWLSSSSTDVPDCKLTFPSFGGKVSVVEYAVAQNEIAREDSRSSHLTDFQGITKIRGEWSIGSSGDLK
ncbi:uncharacterized protein LOC124207753 isoform X2 [Daphnia pulex]|uniref:uncharacterized protein LOC124207753 isoform X2 n=1 Tax=Daphnia pulex TaxID=6669 RepID=UPI001EE047FA|nr:uncharacterized protein LOC124207753 isoform X2 [Daphnia pulex]